ncbi:MAG: acyl carrier protein [Micromonosporaceae bacterium]
MNTFEAETMVRDCVLEVAPEANLDDLPPDADLRETLRLDSLDFLRLVELLSECSGMKIDEDDYPKLASFASTVGYLTAGQT